MTESLLKLNIPLVLASRSPRRLQLLRALGMEPVVHPSDAPEHLDESLSPQDLVRKLAIEKAQEVAGGYPQSLVLGADTIVVLDGSVLGKPADPDHAIAMLTALSGRTHRVYTGIALIHQASARLSSEAAETEVTFATLSPKEIRHYVAGGSPMDKAGAYGIQDDTGALFVESIRGDFYNVVGLPLRTLYQLVVRDFADLLAG